jgi:hypothetical protein
VADHAAQEAALDWEPDLQFLRLDDDLGGLARSRRPALGLGGQQHPGVVVLGFFEDAPDRASLDDAPLVHDRDMVGHVAHDAEVVSDQQHRHAALALQAAQELQDLRLHRHVECRRRLVGDQQIRVVGQRHGDHDALALSARQLVRIALKPAFRIGDAHLGKQLDGAGAGGLIAHRLVQLENLADLPATVCSGFNDVMGS